MVGSVLSESRNTTITSKGNMIEYMFGSFKPPQDICLTKEKRKEIQHQLNENILLLNIDTGQNTRTRIFYANCQTHLADICV